MKDCVLRFLYDERMPLTPGSHLGIYEVLSSLGSGGMGEVYLGRDTSLNRQVAIKILPPEFSSHADRLRRFEQEARSASALNHPNIITIYHIGASDSGSFIAMEYVDGKTLRETLQEGPIPIRRTLQIAGQLAEALSKAHEAGIVHRDLKPENIMITKDGYVKILDFGLAKVATPIGNEKASVFPTAAKTDEGIVLGTVGYMSPEQASGNQLGYRSDQFSIGVILYEMLTGKRPFQKKTSVETLAAIINEDPEPLQSLNPRIAAPLRWIVERCMEKNPVDRYGSTRDLARDLQSIRDHYSEIARSSVSDLHTPAPARRKKLRAFDLMATAIIVVLSIGVYYFWKRSTVQTQRGKPFTAHRLTYRRGPIGSARYSPDGNTIVYSAQWEGKPRELFTTRPDALESRTLGVMDAEVESISRSGDVLVLLIKEDGRKVLAQVSVSGGVPRELLGDVLCADWSPDGSSIVVARYINGQSRIEYPPGKMIYETPLNIKFIRFSPTGKVIAFAERIQDASNGKVVIMDLNGKKIAQSKPSYPEGLAWHSGNEVWFSTLPDNPGDAHMINSMDLQGQIRYIAPFAGSNVEDISTNGDLLLAADHTTNVALVFTDSGAKQSNVTWLDQSEVRDISPDGKSVLIHERGDASESPSGTIYMASADGSGGVRLAAGSPLEFSPDGKSVLGVLDPNKILIVPVGIGAIKTFAALQGGADYPIGWMPDGNRILMANRDATGNSRLQYLSITGGKLEPITEKTLFLLPFGKITSPDGHGVIMRTNDLRYVVLSLKDLSVQPLKNIAGDEEPIEWTKDSQAIYVYSKTQMPCKIYKMNVTTGNRELFKEIIPPDPVGIVEITTFRVSGDESVYAYTYQRVLSDLLQIRGLR